MRESAAAHIVVPTIRRAVESAGLSGGDIKHVAVHEPVAGLWRDISRATNVSAPNHANDVCAKLGDLGAAHALFGFALATARAEPGERILLAGFGSGCDALVFEMTRPMPGAERAEAALREGVALTEYVRFLSRKGTLERDWDVRSEFEPKAQATVLERDGRDAVGFIGGATPRAMLSLPGAAFRCGPTRAIRS